MYKRLLFVYIICIACLTGYAQTTGFDPVTPDDPGANSWNATTGEAIMDRFTPGGLPYTLYQITGERFDLVKSLVVIGKATPTDLYVMYICNQLQTIDLSRTYGYTHIPDSVAVGSAATLKKVILPSCIKVVSDSAFYGCSSLADLQINATTPPVVAPHAFLGVSSSLVVHVPAEAVSLYRTADVWKNLNILPIGEEPLSFYRLTYMIDGSVYKTVNATFGAAVTNPSVVSKTGYTFSGWDKEITSMPAHNDTIRGSYVANKYTVTFQNEDGSEISSASMDYGSALVAPTAPAKEGYTFTGWNPELVEGATVGAANATYRAVYKVNQYTIKFVDYDGTVLSTLTQDYNTTVNAPAPPARTGYTFKQWEYTSTSSATKSMPATMPAEDISLTALYTINQYKVVFKVDGETVSETTADYGSTITFPTVEEQTGKTFSGWDKSDKTVPAKDITITGSYLTNAYKLTFTVDGAEFYTLNVEYGKTIPQIDAPAKEGYTFTEWAGLPSTMPAENTTVTAVYTKNSYKVAFCDEDGSMLKEETLEYGSAITAPADPSKTGYTFISWTPEVASTMPANDVTYTAQYVVNKHKLTLNNEDGTVFETYESVAYGAPLKLVITKLPLKVGYDFEAWVGAPETMPDEDLSLTASFSRTIIGVSGVNYQPDLSADGTALTGTATVLGLPKSNTPSPAKAKVMMLRAKYAEQETEANSVIIPSTVSSPSGESFTVTTIAQNAFSESDITSITIPETVTKIEESAVSGCANLQSVVFLGDEAPEMADDAVVVSDKVEVYVPSTADESSFSSAVKSEDEGTTVVVEKADVVTNYCIKVYKNGETEPYETSYYSFGDNVVLTAPEKEFYDVVWTDKTSKLVSYTNPYIFTAVKDVEVEWSYKAQPYTPGDVNNDGKVNIVDMTLLVSYLNGKTPTVFHPLAADANSDGSIDKSDVSAIATIITGK